MQINGQSYSINNAKKELYNALNSAMFLNENENGLYTGISQSELDNVEKLIDKYMNSDDENDVKVAQSYKDFVNDLKKAEKEYKNSNDYKYDKANEQKHLDKLQKELNDDGSVIDLIKDKIKEFVNRDAEISDEEIEKQNKEKEDLQKYKDSIKEFYEYELKRIETENKNVISSKICYDYRDKNPLSDKPVNISGELYFKD